MPKIMIIDDDINSTKLIKTFLELEGFEVTISLRGSEVLQKALEFQPDAFLVDYNLDDRSGIDVVRELRAVPSFATAPVIMASGQDVSRETKAEGIDLFLIKPYEPDALTKHFATLIG